jgi:hypothetical protein
MTKMTMPLIYLTALVSMTCMSYADNNTIVNEVMPGSHNNGTWIYDSTFDSSGNKGVVQAGMFLTQLQAYNNTAAQRSNFNSQFNQVFSYGGDMEMYCDGGEGGQDTNACGYNSLLLVYYPPSMFNKSYDSDTVAQILSQFGDSGFSSVNRYAGLTYQNSSGVSQKVQTIVDIDGRVDMPASADYLNELNSMPQSDAVQFADKVAAQICADDNISGVQFDIEPFSFLGTKGTVTGPGQKYFYTEISKDFAGNYSGANWPNPSPSKDVLHCVDAAHPYGRVFSVFTFSGAIAEDPNDIQSVFGSTSVYQNGFMVDSLYDLGPNPGGTVNSPADYTAYVAAEATTFEKYADQYGIPYQYAIPAAASAHEFESKAGVATGYQELSYTQAALGYINTNQAIVGDPLFKGINVWGWVQAMWWHGDHYTPDNVASDPTVESYLESQLGSH